MSSSSNTGRRTAEADYFGVYNHIYFLRATALLSAVCDRGRRKRPLPFREHELEDLATPKRERTTFSFRGPGLVALGDEETKTVVVAGQEIVVRGGGCTDHPGGFGRGLDYYMVARGRDRSAVLLVVRLPDSVRYRVTLEPLRRSENTFHLDRCTSLTVFADCSWRADGDTLAFESGRDPTSVGFLVESWPEHDAVARFALVAENGHELSAVLAYAACGPGFTQCFVMDPADERGTALLHSRLSESPAEHILYVGSSEGRRLLADDRCEAGVSLDGEAGSSIALRRILQDDDTPRPVILAPRKKAACGPALYLALRHGADIEWSGPDTSIISLRNTAGQDVKQWEINELIGTSLSSPAVEQPLLLADAEKECVVAQNTLAELLVLQAIGYASLRAAPIVLLDDELCDPSFPETLDSASGPEVCRSVAERAVPASARNPDVDVITVFTSRIPLHLTPCGEDRSEVWRSKYTVVHLPGGLASVLVPRHYGSTAKPAPDVSFGVVFDALADATDTESSIYARELLQSSSTPLVLVPPEARGEVLREVLGLVATDLVLIVAHGERSWIEDCASDRITAATIAQWDLKSAPVVFNNSCSSWTTTSPSFIDAGARAVVASLWPIVSEGAAGIAAHIGRELASDAAANLPELLRAATAESTSGRQSGRSTQDSYICVGLPGTQLLARRPLSDEEVVEVIGRALQELYGASGRLAAEGRVSLAFAMRNAVVGALRRRLEALTVPGEIAAHFPFPMAQFSLLETDLLIALLDVELGKVALRVVPYERQPGLVNWLDGRLGLAVSELSSWDERHDHHLGRSPADRDRWSAAAGGLHIGALGEMGFLKLASGIAREAILPFAATLANLRRNDDAERWFALAAMMVTTPQDLSEDRSVTDSALIRRLQMGIKQSNRVMRTKAAEGGDTVEIELLGNPAERSELANRFGVVCKHLRQYTRASEFFAAARDIAEPGSREYANATSNLGNALREAGEGGVDAALLTALKLQEEAGDYRNAAVTAANLLRLAADGVTDLGPAFIEKARGFAQHLEEGPEQAKQLCDVLSAAARFHASRGDHRRAARTMAEVERYLRPGFHPANLVMDLNSLAMWYEERGDHDRALQQFSAVAPVLERSRLPDAAARTYLMAAQSALQAYTAHGHRKTYLYRFLDCSGAVARLRRVESAKVAGLPADFLESVRENCMLIWEQAQEHGDAELGVAAYRAATRWDPALQHSGWDRLSSALHPKNLEALGHVASEDRLRRDVAVSVTDEGDTRATVTTRWLSGLGSSAHRAPPVIYGYLPLDGEPVTEPRHCDTLDFLPGVAVYEMQPGTPVSVTAVGCGQTHTGQGGSVLYRDIWGSRTFLYDVEIRLGPSLVPVDLRIDQKTAARPNVTVSFERAGCVLRFRPEENDGIAGGNKWLAQVAMLCRRHEPLARLLRETEGPLRSGSPWGLYRTLLDLILGRSAGEP